MKPALLLCVMLGTGVLTTSCATATGLVEAASAPSLLNTHWRLTQLGKELIDNPPGDRAVHLLLQSSSTHLVGFAGCNRMFGNYALEGTSLKFNGVGSTRMFCETSMDLEQQYLGIFERVARWKIVGNKLHLLDAGAMPVAAFETP